MNDLIAHALAFARETFAGDSSGHDYWHTHRVWQLAARLAEAEDADRDIVQLAALLHDVDDPKLSPETAAEKRRARGFLEAEGVPSSTPPARTPSRSTWARSPEMRICV